jgi:hypothetical protein
MSELKVHDVIPSLREKDIQMIKESLSRLDTLTKQYVEAESLFDLEELERIKRNFIGEMSLFNTLYSKTKKYKDESFIYCTQQRKRIKNETVQVLLSEGVKVSHVDNFVYCHPYYVDRLKVLDMLKEFFLKIEAMHEHFTFVGNSIIQSISLCNKERNNSNSQ